MVTSYTSRLGTAPEEGVKAPVVVFSASNITLAGEQTISGVAVVAGDRVLVGGQTDSTENGIYVAATGAWERAKDFNAANDVVNGVMILDTSTKTLYQAVFSGTWTPGTTAITFTIPLTTAGVTVVNTKANLKALAPTTENQTVVVLGRAAVGDGGGGEWRWDSSDLSAQVTADTQSGVYAAPNSDPTGSSGAWVRLFTGSLADAWFGVTADGVTTESVALQAAVDYASYIGGQTVDLSAGVIVAAIVGKNSVTLAGKGYSHYRFDASSSATALKRPSASAQALDLDGVSHFTCKDFDIAGNGGYAATGDAITVDSANYIDLDRIKLIDCYYGFKGDSVTPAGEVKLLNCVIRQCVVGFQHVRDSSIVNTIFSSNKLGIYLNSGQVRILSSFFEFHRDGNLAGNAITLDRNANDILIQGNHFDRNAGNSIYCTSGGGISPRNISIIGNQFKRCAWGTDLVSSQRYSVRFNGITTGINFTGNSLKASNHGASAVYGYYSPIGLVDFGTSIGIVEHSNNVSDNINPFDFNNKPGDLEFTVSGAVATEYYLSDPTTPDTNPYVIQPDYIEHAGVLLTAGTLGALATGEYAWGDNDTLGFSTLYVRLSGDADPNGELVTGIYDQHMIDTDACTSDVSRLHHRDRFIGSINTASTVVFTLETREFVTSTFSRKAFELHISGDESGTGSDAYYVFPFLLSRAGSGGAITIKQGNIQTYETGFTGGWGGAATTMEITITAKSLGGQILVSVENTGANRLDLIGHLKW